MLEIEQTILLSDTAIPIYIINWSREVKNLMKDLANRKIIDENASSATKGIIIKILVCMHNTINSILLHIIYYITLHYSFFFSFY